MNQEFSLNYRNELQFRNYIVCNFLEIDFWTPPSPPYPVLAAVLGPKPILAAALGPESILT